VPACSPNNRHMVVPTGMWRMDKGASQFHRMRLLRGPLLQWCWR
jgi:hypothetical protein